MRSGGIYFEAAGKRGQEHSLSFTGKVGTHHAAHHGEGKVQGSVFFFFEPEMGGVGERHAEDTLHPPRGLPRGEM